MSIDVIIPQSKGAISLPGGSDTQVQFNDAGIFGGDSGLVYNKTTDTLTAGTFSGANVTSGANPGHTHTGTSLSGIDISDDTNLVVSSPITLTGDTVGFNYDLGADLDFNNYKAIALVCDNGATLPTVGVTKGQWFLHTPTGRDILYQYNGSSWKAIYSHGSVTMYVDGGSGSDAQDNGGATGASAFATIQFAINQIPTSYNGNVVVNVASGTQTENTNLQGKFATGNFTVQIIGAMTESVSSQTADSGTTTTATVSPDPGWTVNAYAGQSLRFTGGGNSGDKMTIKSNTSDTITFAGQVNPAVANGDTFVIENWATTVDGNGASAFVIKPNQTAIVLEDLKVTTGVSGGSSYLIDVEPYSGTTLNRVCIEGNAKKMRGVRTKTAAFDLNYCYINDVATNGILYNTGSYGFVTQTYINDVSGRGIFASGGSFLIDTANEYNDCDTACLSITRNSGGTFQGAANNKSTFSNSAIGIQVDSGSGANYSNLAAQIFSGLTTDVNLFLDETTIVFNKATFKLGITTDTTTQQHLRFTGIAAQTGDFINIKDSSSNEVFVIESSGRVNVFDKIAFTQTDGNEYIDSLADGYMDYGASTAHRFNNPLVISNIKSGATQGAAGAAAGEVWKTASHATLPDNVLLIGV